MVDREPTIRTLLLGRTLTQAIQAKGYTSRQLAAELGWAPSKVSRLLAGTRGVRPVDLAALLALCGITGPARERLLRLAGDSAESGWYEECAIDLATLRDVETTARSVTYVDTLTVPLLAQTEDYRRALLGTNPVVTDRITHHRSRQQLLDGDYPPTVRLFIAEHTLTHPGIDRDVLCDQVHHLLRLAVRPQVKVRVILNHCALLGSCPPFQLMTFPGQRPVIYLEHLAFAAFLDQPATVANYQRMVAELHAAALDPELSRTKLATIAIALSEPSANPDASDPVCDGWLGQLLSSQNEADL